MELFNFDEFEKFTNETQDKYEKYLEAHNCRLVGDKSGFINCLSQNTIFLLGDSFTISFYGKKRSWRVKYS